MPPLKPLISNFNTNSLSCLELLFIMIRVGNLYTNLGSYFEISFMMIEVGNLYAQPGVTLSIFHNDRDW